MNPLATQDGGAFVLILAPVAIALIIAQLVWRSRRKKTILQNWAASQGFQLIEYEERRLARGPFFFTTAKGQSVFRIAVQYPDGATATGWAKLGTWAFGLLSDAVNVRWDETKPEPPGFPVIMPGTPDEASPS
jgi:hypothetical protein